ncbi:hypothetical protein GPY61_31560 [Massilia sp. NEAU-DD11]|uniref:Uncharacterized protein n=1 Tax=Massilia cellulosiltytica TaxID=2683234 RepID=A0A7X3G6A4_9BURK|nr:hypothetical protein [Telluria cellulosilytica]MVW64462.1 hypothetical protein [Telluria cellulosilytica]
MTLLNRRVVLAAALIGAMATMTLYETGEIDASAYRALRDGFKHGTPGYRIAIAQAMRSGEVSRWEYRHLLDQYRNENTRFSIKNDATNLREERLVLAAMTRQVKLR